jgi:hypothetical protein
MEAGHGGNPSYLRGRDQEDCGLRSALAESLRDPISTNKKLGVVVYTFDPSYQQRKQEFTVLASKFINTGPYLKNNESKKGCG